MSLVIDFDELVASGRLNLLAKRLGTVPGTAYLALCAAWRSTQKAQIAKVTCLQFELECEARLSLVTPEIGSRALLEAMKQSHLARDTEDGFIEIMGNEKQISKTRAFLEQRRLAGRNSQKVQREKKSNDFVERPFNEAITPVQPSSSSSSSSSSSFFERGEEASPQKVQDNVVDFPVICSQEAQPLKNNVAPTAAEKSRESFLKVKRLFIEESQKKGMPFGTGLTPREDQYLREVCAVLGETGALGAVKSYFSSSNPFYAARGWAPEYLHRDFRQCLMAAPMGGVSERKKSVIVEGNEARAKENASIPRDLEAGKKLSEIFAQLGISKAIG